MNNLLKALVAMAIIGGIAIAVLYSGGKKPAPIPPKDNGTIEAPVNELPDKPFLPDRPVVATMDIGGTVKDDLGAAVVGATVRCEKVSGAPSQPSFEMIVTVTTGDRGSFTVEGLAPQRYRFIASHPGYAEGSTVLTLAEGSSPPAIELVLTSGLTIEGTVRDPLGSPVAGAVVAAFKERAAENASLEDRLKALIHFEEMKNETGVFATSDGTGHYSVQGLEAQEYRLLVTAPGYAPSHRRYVMAGSTGVDFDLRYGGQLSGRVTDLAGAGIADASVEVFVDTGTEDLIEIIQEVALPPLDQKTTDGSGAFFFDTLGGDAGYRLLVRSSGYQTEQVKKVMVALGEESMITVQLRAGKMIRGVVYDPYGTPLLGARCKVNPVGLQPTGPPADFNDDAFTTDASGEFVFDTLNDGNYRLVVSHDEFATFVMPKTQAATEPLTVHLTPGCAVTGRVLEADTHGPIVGALVTIHDVGGEQKSGVSDSSGVFYVRGISETRRGIAHMNIEMDGFERVSNFKVDVAEGTVTEGIDHFLKRNGTVRGVVVDASGKPIPGVSISARRSHASNAVVVNVGKMATSGKDGSFVIEQVQTGDATFLEGSHSNYLKSQSELFAVSPGDNVDGLQLVMRLGGAITGRVLDESGAPIADATVGAKDELMSVVNPASLTNKVYTDASGKFTLRRLEAGEQVLLVAAKSFLTVEVSGHVVYEGKTTADVEIRLATGAFIAGVVRNQENEPVTGARVTVIDTSAGLKKLTTSTDTNGAYRFDELGYYDVEIEAEAVGFSKIRFFDQPVNTEGVDFVLEAFGSICGQVYTDDGEPLRAFSVSPRLIDIGTGRANPRVPSRTFNAPDGKFCFDGLQPGSYEVVIGAPGYAPNTVENVVLSSSRTTDLPAISLGLGGRISGSVYDSTSGNPVPGATVTVVGGVRHFLGQANVGPANPRNRQDQVVVGEDGTFEIIGLKSGRVTLKIEHRLYMTEIYQDIEQGVRDLEIPLGAGGSIEGVITGYGGKLQSGMQILISSPQPGNDRRVVTDRRGRYSVNGLPSGVYTLRVSNFGRPSGDRMDPANSIPYEVDVIAGETSILDIGI